MIDLATGELIETGSYYANGARETYRSNETETVAAEPMGFTEKEADEEVGLTYFGQRYLMAHLGRWASPDPLQTHAVGGGEAVNGYHYVGGNVLQARDPLGLDPEVTIENGDNGRIVTIHATITVVEPDTARREQIESYMRSAVDWWNSQSRTLEVDGRSVTVRFDIRLQSLSPEEIVRAGDISPFEDESSAVPYYHDMAGRLGTNVLVLQLRDPTDRNSGGHRSAVTHGDTLILTPSALGREYTGAHEIALFVETGDGDRMS
ncbi:MAG: RHS repeat-associated core domain-containing protein [Sandaracinus sp.]